MSDELDGRLTGLLNSHAGNYDIRLLAGEARDELRAKDARIAALEAENAAMRKDAERWRIARESDRIAVDVRMDPKGMFLGRSGDRLDKCVDQIREESEKARKK